MTYEVDSADGSCLYRGDDLGLACEIHDELATARPVVSARPPAVPRRTADSGVRAPWKGPSLTPRPT
jgi:hypothetical protein